MIPTRTAMRRSRSLLGGDSTGEFVMKQGEKGRDEEKDRDLRGSRERRE